MPGSITYDPGDVVLAGFATPIGVYRYDPDAAAGQRYTLLPNVVCEHAGQYREGAEPAVARFRYVFDGSNPETPFPRTFAEVWPLTSTGPYVVQPDDRIVVRAFTGQGQSRVLFDGFATIPQVDLGEDGHSVTFTAVDVSARLWDEPVCSARYRNGDDPLAGDVVATDLPVRFNPSGTSGTAAEPNCTPDEHDTPDDPIGGADVGDHPVFLDHRLKQDPEVRTYWTLGKMVRYLLSVHNDQEFVENPDFAVLDQLLDCYAPKADGFYDPDDPDTYDVRPIVIRDFDADNKSLPDCLEDQLGYHGFAYRFATEEDASGEPWHYLEVYRKDASGGGAPLELRLQAEGATLDFGHSNVADLHAARDSQSIANEFVVATDPIRYEVTAVLAPGFEPASGDEDEASRKDFLKSAIKEGLGVNRWKYRRYVADECGEGFWDFADGSTVAGVPFDFSAAFESLLDEDSGDLRTLNPETLARRLSLFAKRLRPGQDTLFTKDATGKPLKAQLALSRDYAGPYPALWDGTGTWQPISGNWELLKDRLGILVTAEDPEAWAIGDYKGSSPQNPGKVLRGIKSIADPEAATTPANDQSLFHLRLTCVIEGDYMIEALATRREASPTRFAVRRRIDARDHFRQEIAAPNSLHNTADDPTYVRDDVLKAKAHAEALRAAHEFAPLAGSVTIPWISFSYEVGQRVDVIDGRGISLRTNIGAEAGEAPQYPTIVSKSWDLSGGKQRTILQLSDRRAEPQRA